MDQIFEVKTNEELGRYAITKRQVKAGEILFVEVPFAFGPKIESPCLCLGCFCFLNGSNENQRCKKCSWPLCSLCGEKFENLANNCHARECEIFQKNSVKFQNSEKVTKRCNQLDCITPLRVLLEKEINPNRWKKEISIMEDHRHERIGTNSWNMDDINIVKYLHGPCKLKERFSEELIQKVIGILEVNAFEAKTAEDISIRCLYPQLAILSHSCTPNINNYIFPSDEFNLKVRSTIDIPEGEQLHSCYTYTLNSTKSRQEHLKATKYFTCRCKRCLDPTELDTHFSSFKCNKCDFGLILSTNPIDENAEWKCTQCPFKTSGFAIQKACDVMQKEIDDELKILEYGPERLQMCERLLKKYRSVLHPKHHIEIGLKQELIEMYGRIKGYEIHELPQILLERKIDLCLEVLKILEIVEPGKVRSRALLLYELHVPFIMITRARYQLGELSNDDLKMKINEIIKMLEECIEILDWEDPTSYIGALSQVARQGLQQLKDSLPVSINEFI